MTTIRWTAVALAAATLAACGGGGDDGGVAPVATAPTIAVTSDNYVAAAGEGAAAATDVADLSDYGSLVGAQEIAMPNWTALGVSSAARALKHFDASSPVLVGARNDTTVACDSGTMTLTAWDNNNNRVADAGDSVSLNFSSCSFAFAGTMNGVLDFTFNQSPTGDLNGSFYTLDATMSFRGLSVADGTDTATANGSLRLVSVRTGLSTGSETLTTPSFAVTSVIAGSTYARSLGNYSASITLSPTQTVTRFRGVVSSSALNGAVAVDTPEPFVRASSDAFPSSGSATATGTRGTATLTAINATQVRIDLDADSNGTVEQSQTRLWSSIL